MSFSNKLIGFKNTILFSNLNKVYLSRGLCSKVDPNNSEKQTHFGFQNVSEKEKEERGIIYFFKYLFNYLSFNIILHI